MWYGTSLNIHAHPGHGGSLTRADVPPDSAPFQAALEAIQDGVAITERDAVDGDSRFMFVNPAFAALSGCPECELLGKSLRSEEITRIDETLLRCLVETHRQPARVSVEVVVGRIGEGDRSLRLRSAPVCDPSGETTHRVMILHDISGEKYTEAAVSRNERLVGIGLLATGIAHEINNPTGSALLAAETALAIMGQPGADEKVAACLENIVASADRCGRIVRTLLRYSRDESPEMRRCNLNDVAEQAVDLTRPHAERHGVAVRLRRDPRVPLASMNPLEIELVLVNLIRNAIQACGKGAEVLVRTACGEGLLRASVSDNGRGMTTEQITHAFDPLYTTRKHAGGSGLGLSIASGIIQRHLGCMEVLSEAGRGTTVTINLPCASLAPSIEGKSGAPCHGTDSDYRERETFG